MCPSILIFKVSCITQPHARISFEAILMSVPQYAFEKPPKSFSQKLVLA